MSRLRRPEVDVGATKAAAWSATSKANKPYLSVRLDDPSFAGAIYCRLIGTEGESLTTRASASLKFSALHLLSA